MDSDLKAELEQQGMPTDPMQIQIGLPETPTEAPGADVLLLHGETTLTVQMKPLGSLFEGARIPPRMGLPPPDEYLSFFVTLERVAAHFSDSRERPECDQEFQRLYRQLKRRPDGTDRNPLFHWLRSAAQLYVSLRPISRAEFEAVLGRLEQSAKTFGSFAGSANYFEHALSPLLG